MTTNQPEWELVANLGDVSFADYGGLLVFRDTTGVYPEEGEYWESATEAANIGEVYRFSLDRCTYVNGVLSDNKFHPEVGAWWDGDLKGLSESMDRPVEEYIRLFCSGDPVDRGRAYLDAGLYFGFDNLDNYPLRLTKAEARERYKDI